MQYRGPAACTIVNHKKSTPSAIPKMRLLPFPDDGNAKPICYPAITYKQGVMGVMSSLHIHFDFPLI